MLEIYCNKILYVLLLLSFLEVHEHKAVLDLLFEAYTNYVFLKTFLYTWILGWTCICMCITFITTIFCYRIRDANMEEGNGGLCSSFFCILMCCFSSRILSTLIISRTLVLWQDMWRHGTTHPNVCIFNNFCIVKMSWLISDEWRQIYDCFKSCAYWFLSLTKF